MVWRVWCGGEGVEGWGQQSIIHIPLFLAGGAYWVYPGASHNRFEHSIG